MKYFKTTLILFSLLFNYSYSFGQSFSLSELIKMSKMDSDGFDTFVASKGYSFQRETIHTDISGLTYSYKPSINDERAEKFITLFSKYLDKKYRIDYQTLDIAE